MFQFIFGNLICVFSIFFKQCAEASLHVTRLASILLISIFSLFKIISRVIKKVYSVFSKLTSEIEGLRENSGTGYILYLGVQL